MRRCLPPGLGIAARGGEASVRRAPHRRVKGSAMTEVVDATAAGRARRERIVVNVLRVSVLVVVIGGWELLTRVGALDPFFFGRPSLVVLQIRDWIRDGTEAGPLWTQVWVTLQEALLGFAIGVVAGIVCGIALGRVRLLSRIFGPYLKVLNSIPRIVLGSIFIVWLGLGLPSKGALAAVLAAAAAVRRRPVDP